MQVGKMGEGGIRGRECFYDGPKTWTSTSILDGKEETKDDGKKTSGEEKTGSAGDGD